MRISPSDDDDRPCRPRPLRRSCRHYDCMMARGEPLPDGVVGYIDGVLYTPSTTESMPVESVPGDPEIG